SALASLASAQTWTDCNPLKKTCPNNPAMGAKFETDFKAGQANVKGWKQTAGSLKYTPEGAEFTITKKGESPTIQSETYLHFGYVEVKCKASGGQGIISSIVLQSEDLDEVDWEFIGTTTTNVQMNYFGKGNTTTYDRMIEGPVNNPQGGMHTYALNWTSESLTWIIDEKPVRTLKYGDANGGKNYPQTPSNIRIGIWAGGDPDNEKGVIEWAGGQTDYSKAPFTMTIESVKVTNYNPGTEYKWKDQSGSFESIEVIGAENKDGNAKNSAAISAPASTGAAATGGQGLGSQVNVPTATGTAAGKTGGEFHEGKPSQTGAYGAHSGTVPAGPAESPCSCGVATVTVTGGVPPAPPATTLLSSAQPISSKPASSVVIPPPVSSAKPISSPSSVAVPPPVTVPASNPPYPKPSGGIMTDTKPAPSVPFPTGGVPVANGTTTGGIPQFTGAASSNKVGGIALGLAAG
ncbi:glycoside hydrolase family 16 protein, partial [Zopfia rhizophila CBS 207.26]